MPLKMGVIGANDLGHKEGIDKVEAELSELLGMEEVAGAKGAVKVKVTSSISKHQILLWNWNLLWFLPEIMGYYAQLISKKLETLEHEHELTKRNYHVLYFILWQLWPLPKSSPTSRGH